MPTDHSSFSSFLPPPNITGSLHIGHSYNQIITDIILRQQRTKGSQQVYWFAGLDHAGIAAQLVIKTFLSKTSAQPLNRKSYLLESLWEWCYLVKETIRKQSRCTGVSLNWLRSYFTLSSKTSDLLRSLFLKLDMNQLIYRDLRLVNWDPVAKTVLSDLEVVCKSRTDYLWYIRYHSEPEGTELLVCTTRPETLFAVAAIVVNPKDRRYFNLHNTSIRVPIVRRLVPVILDTDINSCFGSGAVKLVPSHCKTDFRTAVRHNLEPVIILDSQRKLNTNTPFKYRNKDYGTCKPSILLDLKFRGSIAYAVEHFITVPLGNRTGAVVEPLLTRQWFLSLSKGIAKGTHYPGLSLAQIASEAIRTKQICFFPSKWKRACCDWLEIVEDWCLSRQLEWGHCIPSQLLLSSDNVLDTWFSSSAIPLSSILQLSKGYKLSNILPFSILVTGFDILFFWVTRMLMISLYCSNRIPFAFVYVHGLFCDKAGIKMSKSKGNVLNPESFVSQNHAAPSPGWHVDVFRTALASIVTLNRHIMFDHSKFRGFGSLYLKVKSISTFIALRLERLLFMPLRLQTPSVRPPRFFLGRWILSELYKFCAKANKLILRHRHDQLISCTCSFIRTECCEHFIEMLKQEEKVLAWSEKFDNVFALMLVLQKILQTLYPFAPSIASAMLNHNNKSFTDLVCQKNCLAKLLIFCEAKSFADACCNDVIKVKLTLIELLRITKTWHQDNIILALGRKRIESLLFLKSLTPYSKVLFFRAEHAIDFVALSTNSPVGRIQLGGTLLSMPCRPSIIDVRTMRSFKASAQKLLSLSYICSSKLEDIIIHLSKHKKLMSSWSYQFLRP